MRNPPAFLSLAFFPFRPNQIPLAGAGAEGTMATMFLRRCGRSAYRGGFRLSRCDFWTPVWVVRASCKKRLVEFQE
ncbi:hypothetical protein AMEX_G9130 [Astyanax mexicanus]|uniref:Uncharacterized protein n=1 Tax=Astyanax mexicanus TaxID=7994 RepID=A0A8T2M0P6_ASTMX|nr:hypothetical protein AMEX_G9130 [Astyanax mexicanus]